jgi:hypothetical protein
MSQNDDYRLNVLDKPINKELLAGLDNELFISLFIKIFVKVTDTKTQ